MNCFDGKVLYIYSNVTETSGLQLEGTDNRNYLSRREASMNKHEASMAVGPA